MRIICIWFVFLLIISCTSRNTMTEITGVISYASGVYLQLHRYEFDKSFILDSVKIKRSGKFRFKLDQKEPGFFMINPENNNYAILLLEPGDKVQIYGDYWNLGGTYDVSGSEQSQQIRNLDIQLFITRKKLDSLLLVYEASKDHENYDNIIKDLDKNYLKIVKDFRDSTIFFIINNLNSLVAIYALQQKFDEQTYVLNRYRDLQYYKIVYQSLSKKYPGITLVKLLERQLNELESYYSRLKLFNLAAQAKIQIPELRLPTPEGDTISLLETLKNNKLLLLNYWASWDQNSRRQNMELKKVYRKYRQKGLEIYSVSLDNEKDQWQKSITIDSLVWINVSDLSYPDSKSAGIYNVSRIPANYLINHKGDILAKNLKGDRMWDHLAETFKEK